MESTVRGVLADSFLLVYQALSRPSRSRYLISVHNNWDITFCFSIHPAVHIWVFPILGYYSQFCWWAFVYKFLCVSESLPYEHGCCEHPQVWRDCLALQIFIAVSGITEAARVCAGAVTAVWPHVPCTVQQPTAVQGSVKAWGIQQWEESSGDTKGTTRKHKQQTSCACLCQRCAVLCLRNKSNLELLEQNSSVSWGLTVLTFSIITEWNSWTMK